jgi:hypothetical protein
MIKSFEEKLAGTIIERSLDKKQFYVSEWSRGTIQLVNGKRVTDELLKYNGYLDKFVLFKAKTGQQVLLNDEEIREVDLKNDNTGSTKYFVRAKIKQWFNVDSIYTYLEVLAKGNTSLYARRKIDFFPAANEYKPVIKYFVGMSDGSVHPLNPSNRNFLTLIGKQNESFRTDLRKERLNIRAESDFIRAINLYNEFLTRR